MQDWQERVIEEKFELDERIFKLVVFMKAATFFDLPEKVIELMKKQLETMYDLSKILEQRILLFKG